MRRYVLIGLAMIAMVSAVIAAGPTNTAAASPVVVSQGNMNGWYFWNDFNDTFAGSPGELVAGPAVPPLGAGSVRLGPLTTASGATGQSVIATDAYYNGGLGTPLADLTTLSYSTYQPGPTLAIAIQFDVRYRTADTAYGGRLVFEPYQNGAVTVGSGWQSWSPLSGRWWASKTTAPGTGGVQVVPLPAGNCAVSSPCTWSEINAAFPAAAVFGRFLLKAGSSWAGFDGNADNLTIGVSGVDTTYDFEPDCSTDCYVRTDGNDANTGLADTPTDAKKTVQAAVNQVSAGGTVHVAAGTYNEQVTVNRNLTLTGSGAATTIIQAPGVLTNDPDGAKTVVLFTGPITAAFSGFTVQGPVNGINFGIYVRAGATANIHDNIIKDIRDNPLSGAQTGVAIEVGKTPDTAPGVSQTGTATITNNAISGYQKTGIAVENTGSSATITGNTITGAGAITTTAQNGIQIRRGAIATITTNTVTGNAYDGPTYSAEGIGALHAGNGVVIQGNIVNHNSANIYAWKSDGIQVLNNQVSDSSPVDQNASAGITVQSDGPSCCGGATGAYITGVTISGNTIQNNLSGGSSQGDGIDIYDVNGATVSGNTITGASHDGILIGGSGNTAFTNNQFSGNGLGFADPNAAAIDFGGQPSGNGGPNTLGGFTAHSNSFVGNRNGIWNYDIASVNATDNWWGSANGPQHASNSFNVGSQGDKVSDNVTFVPWLNAAPPTGMSFAPVTDTNPVGSFASIQTGVNASNLGGTVNAAAGTFTENVVIGNQVTIAGAGQAITNVIPAVSNPNCGGAGGGSLCTGGSYIMLVQADNVTIHDLTLDGDNPALTSGIVESGADLDARNAIITNHALGVYQNLVVHHTTIKNIYLRGIYASSGGSFDFHHDTVQNVKGSTSSIGMFNFGGAGTFANNTVSDTNDAIASNWSMGSTYTNNAVTDSGSGIHTDNNGGSGGVADALTGNSVSNCKTNGYGVWVFAPFRPVTVSQNTVTNCAVGLTSAGQQSAVTIAFTDNEVDGQNLANSTGVYVTTSLFGFGAANSTVTMTGNTIKDNADGFYIESTAGKTASLDAQRNSIPGNTNSGVSTSVGGLFDIKMTPNWWGSDTGPTHVLNPLGTGDSVPNGVIYSPWIGIGTDASPATGFQLVSPMTWIAGPAVCGATCIQAAIDDASNGDTVKVRTGVFPEHVVVNKQITLTAGSNPIIDGGGSGDGITVTVPNVTVSLFEVRNVTNGIVVATGANNASITGNVIKNHHQRGVNVDASTNVLVDGNTIDGQGGGTTAAGGTTPDSDTRYYGIFAVDSTGTLSNNIIKGITHGLANGAQSGVGIRLAARAGAGSSNMTISGNDISDVQKNAMVITNAYGGASVNANVTGNTVAGNGPIAYIAQNGIQVSGGATASVTNNDVSGYDYTPNSAAAIGILLFGAGTTSVTGNNVHNLMEGMYVQSTNNAIVTGNSFTNVRDTSIFVYLSNNGTYSGNTVMGQPASTGMYVYDSSSTNSVTGNAFRNGDFGVIVDFTGAGTPASNLFNGNCLAGNIGAGVQTSGSLVGPKVNATGNWWGAVDGANPPGSGDSIIPGNGSTIDASAPLIAPVAGCPDPGDSDFDGLSDVSEVNLYLTDWQNPDTDADGCGDGKELTFVILNPTNPWDFYSVPVPALFAAPNPLVVFKDHTVSAADAQAVFAYFKAGARTGLVVYEQDLNNNGVKDGVEYDRSVVGPGHSGPPDGTVSAQDAQLAFAQFKLGYQC